MKLWKHTLITAIAFFGIAASVLYTSCEKDSCLDLKCHNGGSCAEGFCRCPTGYEGTECEIKSVDKFLGAFYGNNKCNNLPPLTDTIDIFLVGEPNQVKLVQHSRITDTLTGTVAPSGIEITVPTQEHDIYKRNISVTMIGPQLKFYFEEIININTSQKNVCYFTGYRH
jgi:cellobiose-specific phosphotransferase system component IIB